MYPAKVLKEGPAPGSKHLSIDEMILDADGFAGVFPEHKFEIVKRLQGLGHLVAMVRMPAPLFALGEHADARTDR